MGAMRQMRRAWIGILETLFRVLDRMSLPLGNRIAIADHLQAGRRGEEAAYYHLRRLGYTVVARRWRSPRLRGDIDLIAWEGDILCFVEVKSRTSRSFATAESAVDEEKSSMLRAMARQYLRALPAPPRQVRLDIVSVYFAGRHNLRQSPEFELFRGALPFP